MKLDMQFPAGWQRKNGHTVLQRGYGTARGHFGEVFQGQLDGIGCKRRCLMSLPSNELWSCVELGPDTSGVVTVQPVHKEKARSAASLTLAYLNKEWVGGQLKISSNIQESKGCGSSTADCVAATIAAANAVKEFLAEEEIAHLVVEAERASDSTMFTNAVLFAHREGQVIEDFAAPFPHLEVLGVDTDPTGCVNTIEYPPAEYSRRNLEEFEVLAGALRRAIKNEDKVLLGRVATSSAFINEQFLPKVMFTEIHRIAQKANALGIAVAHSGTVASILFDPMDCDVRTKRQAVMKELISLGLNAPIEFVT